MDAFPNVSEVASICRYSIQSRGPRAASTLITAYRYELAWVKG